MTDEVGFGSVAPILACDDVLATAYWYRDVLGFGIDDKYSGESWGMLWAEGSQVFLSNRPDLVKTAKGQQILIACRDVDAVFARHRANGAKIVSPLQTQPWGLREYTVEDPNGYHLRFQTWVGSDNGDGTAKTKPSLAQAQPAFPVSNKATRFRATVPRLPVADVTATLEFYVYKLRFKPLYRFDGEAGVGLGDIIVRFCEGEPVTNENLSIYFEITDTDEVFQQYVAEGVEVGFPPKDQPWGSRDFCIEDPNGYRLVFGDFRDDSKRKQPSPRMEKAIATMIAGDIAGLRHLLVTDSELVSCTAPAAYRDNREATLLHFLVDYPDGNHPSNVVEIAKLLIDSGAHVESLDGNTEGSTPLQLLMGLEAPTPHEVELTELLLDSGATTTNGNVDQHGMDAFSVALINGHTECAALMYDRGYPANFPWAGAGLGNMSLVRSFFGEGDDATLPADQCDSLGEEARRRMNCAFLVASINGQTEVVEYLLGRGMDVDMQPPGSDFAGIGATALHWAVRFGRQNTVELLIAQGANVHARDDVFQLTPAGWAAWFGNDEIERFLLTKEEEANS